MEETRSRTSVAAPISALVLAAVAATCLAVADSMKLLSGFAEDVFGILVIFGWALMAWAAIIGVAYAVVLGVRAVSRRPVSRVESVLAAAALALVAAVLATHPLWGSGSAVG